MSLSGYMDLKSWHIRTMEQESSMKTKKTIHDETFDRPQSET